MSSWQLKTEAKAQAGNRASKTQCYLQWWESRVECQTVTSGGCKLYHLDLIAISAHSPKRGCKQIPPGVNKYCTGGFEKRSLQDFFFPHNCTNILLCLASLIFRLLKICYARWNLFWPSGGRGSHSCVAKGIPSPPSQGSPGTKR